MRLEYYTQSDDFIKYIIVKFNTSFGWSEFFSLHLPARLLI